MIAAIHARKSTEVGVADDAEAVSHHRRLRATGFIGAEARAPALYRPLRRLFRTT